MKKLLTLAIAANLFVAPLAAVPAFLKSGWDFVADKKFAGGVVAGLLLAHVAGKNGCPLWGLKKATVTPPPVEGETQQPGDQVEGGSSVVSDSGPTPRKGPRPFTSAKGKSQGSAAVATVADSSSESNVRAL